jgi:hypothetical protein
MSRTKHHKLLHIECRERIFISQNLQLHHGHAVGYILDYLFELQSLMVAVRQRWSWRLASP